MLHVVHHPGYVVATDSPGTFPHDKYALVMRALGESGAAMTVHVPEIMPRAWLEAVHDPTYVEEVVTCTVPAEKQRRIGFAIDERISRRSQLSPGGTWLAAKLALQHGYAANSAGGSHHALAETGAGYCVFNDLAVAANRLIEREMPRASSFWTSTCIRAMGPRRSRRGVATFSRCPCMPRRIFPRERRVRRWTSPCPT
jgi:acetoin utilization deacetylase AcuC-like enzyme